MNKKMKKTAALALAVGMAVTGSMASYASGLGNATISDVEISTSNAEGTVGGSQDSVLTGTIKVTSISVKVPTAAAFEMNPNLTVSDSQVNRITAQSGEYKITNTSTVPIDVSITKVTTNATGGFTNDATKLIGTGNDKKVMFAVRKSTEAAPTSAAGDKVKWFDPAPGTGAVSYKVSTTDGDNTLAAGEVLEMKLYGATVQGWSNNETFTVTPTFTISVH